MTVYFDWDDDKNQSNQQKHDVSFELAMHVFKDPLCKTVQERVVDGEVRYQTLGVVGGELVLLLVAHTLDENDDSSEYIRIISARKATQKERREYEQE
ncbi:MAG: BrnT family toxin [Pseudomonadota bacterium]